MSDVEIKPDAVKDLVVINAEIMDMREQTFLDFQDLKDPLPDKSKFKESGEYDKTPIDF